MVRNFQNMARAIVADSCVIAMSSWLSFSWNCSLPLNFHKSKVSDFEKHILSPNRGKSPPLEVSSSVWDIPHLQPFTKDITKISSNLRGSHFCFRTKTNYIPKTLELLNLWYFMLTSGKKAVTSSICGLCNSWVRTKYTLKGPQKDLERWLSG